MFGRKKAKQNVMGHEILAPKPTRWAYLYILKYIALPIGMVLTGMDIILYFIFKYAFNSCYGVFCLIG
ncbi:hypothetical protein MNBD_ALPHA01-150 [hydrothermal vent metagenome]|uniref:Uncharacterized protein n=1 Tax=hydrothermal vent metagenome TaxID=652676 RepID=A0A3B0S4N4_9ZZZZ